MLDGVLLRSVTVGETATLELLGAGDVVVPAADRTTGGFVDAEVGWSALVPVRLAIIGPSVVQRLSEWPGVMGVVVQRMAERAARQAVMQAICHNPRVEARLRGTLWHLGERWGRVTAAGVVLPLRLTHEALALLVGAQRPTVSTALKALHEAGEISRRPDGAWVLLPESQERLEQLNQRVANRRPTLALIDDEDNRSRTMHEQLERLQLVSEQQQAAMLVLRRRAAELRAEAQDLARGLRRIRGDGADGNGPSHP